MIHSAYFVKSNPLRAFTGSFQHFAVTGILKMCMKKFDAEKIFLSNWQSFQLSHFLTTALSKQCWILHTL